MKRVGSIFSYIHKSGATSRVVLEPPLIALILGLRFFPFRGHPRASGRGRCPGSGDDIIGYLNAGVAALFAALLFRVLFCGKVSAESEG